MSAITRGGLDLYIYVRFNQLLIKLRGDFNITTLQAFVSRMRILKEHYNKQFVFDAKYLYNIDSSGISTLVNLTKVFRKKPALYNIRDEIMDIFNVSGVPYVYTLYKTEKAFRKYN